MISDKDLDFFREVTEYFENTKKEKDPEGSINQTALHFGINRNKARKILVTTGSLKNELTEKALKLKQSGSSVKEIAAALKVSEATVSTYLPYDKVVKSTLQPGKHTSAVRQYRAYEKNRSEKQVQNREKTENRIDNSWKDEWIKEVRLSYKEDYARPRRKTWKDIQKENKKPEINDPYLQKIFSKTDEYQKKLTKTYEYLSGKNVLTADETEYLDELKRLLGRFPGALADKDRGELEKLSGDRLPYEPVDVVRLHLELINKCSDNDRNTIQKFGNLKGERISRDVVVPYDIPLYAIHYLIQRLFGWQNSHLHRFEMPEEKTMQFVKNKAEEWRKLCGLVFRYPDMFEDDLFWADDYERGSFKNWLTKKYTGPYQSRCYGESYVICQEFMKLYKDDQFYVCFTDFDGKERITDCYRVYGFNGQKNYPLENTLYPDRRNRVEIMNFSDLPFEALWMFFQTSVSSIIERLPLFSILLPKDSEERPVSGDDMLKKLKDELDELSKFNLSNPEDQPLTLPFTDELHYFYDFGDGWMISITSSYNCEDLMDRISQDQLDKANIKCRELYRPVTLLADGDSLLDDVGGISGYADFLNTINPDLENMDRYEKKQALTEKRESLSWSKWMGWKKLSPMI